MANEGSLYKGSFGGDAVHTEDHPPIFCNGIMEDGHGGVATGTLLIRNAGGKLEKYSGTGTLAGVCAIAVNDDQTTATYVAHGTVRTGMLKLADGTSFTNHAALAAIGVYAV